MADKVKKPVPKQKEPEQTVGDKKSTMQKRPDEPASPTQVDRKPTKKQDPRE